MNKNSIEEGITNLGFVPEGKTFAEAIAAIKHKKKYLINAYEGGHRLTICDTLRMIMREINTLEDTHQKRLLIDYIAQAFDFGKRMDARMKYLKSILDENGIDYEKGGKPQL